MNRDVRLAIAPRALADCLKRNAGRSVTSEQSRPRRIEFHFFRMKRAMRKRERERGGEREGSIADRERSQLEAERPVAELNGKNLAKIPFGLPG
jgi:hypothetical protein